MTELAEQNRLATNKIESGNFFSLLAITRRFSYYTEAVLSECRLVNDIGDPLATPVSLFVVDMTGESSAASEKGHPLAEWVWDHGDYWFLASV
jgi:hypothetical protein